MSTSQMLKSKDIESNEYKDRLKVLSLSNPNLYQFIIGASKEASFPGIREDVLSYIFDHHEDFRDDHEYAYNISQFTCNPKIDPAWYQWLNENSEEISAKIPIIDFCLILSEAVEKNVSLSDFKKLYDKHSADPLYIFEDLDSYSGGISSSDEHSPESDSSGTDKEEKAVESRTKTLSEEVSEDKAEKTAVYVGNAENVVSPDDEGLSSLPSYNREPEYAQMFNNLLTIMTDRHDNERFDMQNKVSGHLSELSVLFSNIFRLWESDKNEMERLEALYKLQQKVLYNQQKKINEMRNTIANLQFQLNEAGKMDIKREEIKKKISEVQSMMSSDYAQIGMGEL